MLRVTSIFRGCSVQAKDGKMGSISDVLFDGESWKIRWLVVDTGGWLGGRKVLVRPSAAADIDGRLDKIYVELTKQQILGSPGIVKDLPVCRQINEGGQGYYGWDPLWGDQGVGGGSMVFPPMSSPLFGGTEVSQPFRFYADSDSQDPNLRSAEEVTGYHIQAADGAIGHLLDFLVDDEVWAIRYLIIDTRNWLPGAHVMVAPNAVEEIDWLNRRIRLNVTREQVSHSTPAWQPDCHVAAD